MDAGNGVQARLHELERRVAVLETRTETGIRAVERFDNFRVDMVRSNQEIATGLADTRRLTWRVGLAIVIAAATGIATDLIGLV